ncbi:MAG: hypothetical protein ACXABY_10055 [Candidatus Thorarchaeota archaeon]|jgi:hypothetical protein
MPEPQAHEPVEKTFGFDGAWMPDFDPSKMGEENFAELRNYRYVEDGIEPIEGYTKLTTNPTNATYLFIRDGVQLRQSIGTATSYVIVFAWDSGETAGRIYENRTAIPSAGDFETAALFTPTSPTDPRFSTLPRGIGFCSGTETCVYEGKEANAGIVILVDSISGLAYTNPRDYSEELSNTLSGTNDIMAIIATARTYIIGSTRPLKGFNVQIKTANATAASTLDVKEWTGGAWASCTTIVDGTASGGITHAQSGDVTFDTTVGSADPTFIDNVYLYHYQVILSDGTCEIQQITVDMPFQNSVDIWDGVFRTCISYQALVNTVPYADYTLEVNEESNIDFPITAKMDAFRTDAGDILLVASEERSTAIKVEILGGRGNVNASVLTIKYWDGDSYETVGTIQDGTLNGGATFGQSGVISWNPPAQNLERAQTLFGVTGYFYQITASAAWDAEVEVDFVSMIPRTKEIKPHVFPTKFATRAFFGAPAGEDNALDYTASSTIDVHNGLDSSASGQRIYVGDGGDALTAARSVYNRFGSSIYETLLVFKNNETHLLTGTGPADFRLFRVSENYGCPAPRTLVGAEVGYQMGGGAFRNVVMWLSYRGPVIFDGAVILPIPGVDLYFDTRKDTVINTGKIANSVAWFDPFWKEFHLMIPSGSSQTTLNTHLVYDLTRKKWWKVNYDGGAADIPQFGMVVRDTDGSAYPYVFRNDGHMLRFGFGTDWGGNALTHLVKTADVLPGGFWNLTQLNTLKIGHHVPDFVVADSDIAINVKMYIDGAADGAVLDVFNISVDKFITEDELHTEAGLKIFLAQDNTDYLIFDNIGKKRYWRHIQHLNEVVHSVAFEFSRTSTGSSYLGNFGKSFVWWGFSGAIVGRDERGDDTS